MSNVRSFLYNPPSSTAAEQTYHHELLALQTQLEQTTQKLLLQEEQNRALQRDAVQMQTDSKKQRYELQEKGKKIREMQLDSDILIEELKSFKSKCQQLELIKFEQAEKIDDLNARLLDISQKYAQLSEHFDEHVESENQKLMEQFVTEQEQQELARQQLIQLHENQLASKQQELRTLQIQSGNFEAEARELQLQLQESKEREAEQAQLLNQAYTLYKQRKQTDMGEALGQTQNSLKQLDADLEDQDQQFASLLAEVKRIQSQFAIYQANQEVREPTGAKTIQYLKDQLQQKAVENMQLSKRMGQFADKVRKASGMDALEGLK